MDHLVKETQCDQPYPINFYREMIFPQNDSWYPITNLIKQGRATKSIIRTNNKQQACDDCLIAPTVPSAIDTRTPNTLTLDDGNGYSL
jgi:hypothetical protein